MKFVAISFIILIVVPALSAPPLTWSLFGHHDNNELHDNTETTAPGDEVAPPTNTQEQYHADLDPPYCDKLPPAKLSISPMSHEPSPTDKEPESTSSPKKVKWYTMPFEPGLSPGLYLYYQGPTLFAPPASSTVMNGVTSTATVPTTTATASSGHRQSQPAR